MSASSPCCGFHDDDDDDDDDDSYAVRARSELVRQRALRS
jgi:hypothetical protein